jgi:Flp pilus assembly protein protease CpaA
MTTPDALVISTIALGAGTGAAIDLTSRRIPNVISLATTVAGLALAASGLTGISIAASLAGMVLGLVLTMPGYVFGATGAGDVKLFAAAGAVLGAPRIVDAFLWTAVAGGVIAVGIAWYRGRLTRTVARTLRLCRRPVEERTFIADPGEDNAFPYAPAIAAGCLMAAIG